MKLYFKAIIYGFVLQMIFAACNSDDKFIGKWAQKDYYSILSLYEKGLFIEEQNTRMGVVIYSEGTWSVQNDKLILKDFNGEESFYPQQIYGIVRINDNQLFLKSSTGSVIEFYRIEDKEGNIVH